MSNRNASITIENVLVWTRFLSLPRARVCFWANPQFCQQAIKNGGTCFVELLAYRRDSDSMLEVSLAIGQMSKMNVVGNQIAGDLARHED